MNQQKASTTKLSPLSLAQPHSTPSHPFVVGIYPSKGDARDTTMALASSIMGHKGFHESNHSNSDNETTNITKPLDLELAEGNVVIVSSISIPNNSS